MKSAATLLSNRFCKLVKTQPITLNYSFRSFHSNFQTNNLNQHDENLHDEICQSIRDQEYSKATRKVKRFTKNWLGFYKCNDDNLFALYLHGLLLLESSKYNVKLKPLYLASNSDYKKAHLLLATLEYLDNMNYSTLNGDSHDDEEKERYRNYLEKFDETVNWNDEKMVELTIENYLKELIENCDSRFAYYALGKFYMKNQEYQQAYEAFVKSTEKDYKRGQYELGLLMRNGSPDGKISKRPELALKLFKKTRLESHKELVEMYLNGEGTEASYFNAKFQSTITYLVKFLHSRWFKVMLMMIPLYFLVYFIFIVSLLMYLIFCW